MRKNVLEKPNRWRPIEMLVYNLEHILYGEKDAFTVHGSQLSDPTKLCC